MPERRRCILNCPKVKGTTLYCFPKDEIRRQVWLGLIEMEYTSRVHTYICGRHFSPRMFHNTRLKRDAVPDINLKYVEYSAPTLEDENESFFECISLDEDSSSNLEVAQSVQPTAEAIPCQKSATMTKYVKILPKRNVLSDPLYVPTLTSASLARKPFKIVDGRPVYFNSKDEKPKNIEETTDTQTAAVQPMIRINTINTIPKKSRSMRIVERLKSNPKTSKTRAPLAPLEMRLATRIWQSAECDSDSPQKLPTLQTTRKTSTLPVRSAPNQTEKTKTVPSKNPQGPHVKPANNHVISPAGPVRVKNIHDLDESWKEQAKLVAEQTESAKHLLAVIRESLENETHTYSLDSSDIIIEEDIEIDDGQNFTEQALAERRPFVVLPEGSKIVSNSESLNGSKEKLSMSDLLCDEVLPNDDDLIKPAKPLNNSKLIQNTGTQVEMFTEEIFDGTINSTSRGPSNILMMGVEDFKKIADDSPDCNNLTFISEPTQTGTYGKQACGFIEKYSHNGAFNLTCFYCASEFPVWEWQQFIDHMSSEHKSEMKPKVRSIALERQVTMRIPKTYPLKSYPHYTSEDIDGLLANCTNIQYVLVQGAEPNTVALMPLQHILGERALPDAILNSVKNFHHDESNEDSDRESLSSLDPDEFRQSEDVINFKKSPPARITQFLEALREHPLLWHTRRHGPTLYDEEAEKFLTKFDRTMSPMNFRSSMEYLRTWYRRYVPPTTAIKEKLEVDSQRREYVERLTEIDELSKTLAFYCDQCPYYFLDNDRLETHRYLRHNIGDLKYACSCGLRFAEEKRKNDHEQLHKPKPSFMCELCGMSFLFNRSLANHMNTKHPDVIENPLPYKCNECDARFPNSQSRSWHALKHAPPRFNCNICGQSYLKSFPYKQHMKKHIDQRDFVCEDCGKAFVEKRGLINHRYRVHKAGGYHCEHCDTYYSSYEKLFMHNQIRHPNGTYAERVYKTRTKSGRERKRRSCCSHKPRIFKCKQCGTVFDRQYQLIRHKRVLGHHLGEQYFKCSNCTVICKSRVALVRHLRSVHNLPITFADVKEEDYCVPPLDNKLEESSRMIEESEYAVQTIACTEEDNIIVEDEEIQEIFEEFDDGTFKIVEQVVSNDHVS